MEGAVQKRKRKKVENPVERKKYPGDQLIFLEYAKGDEVDQVKDSRDEQEEKNNHQRNFDESCSEVADQIDKNDEERSIEPKRQKMEDHQKGIAENDA